jgi:RluA family pseudouridine synthase
MRGTPSMPNSGTLHIIHRDDDLVAIAKPAGRIVIPGRGAAAAERSLRQEVAELLGREPLVVHRLDRGTSGVLLFALTAPAHRALSLAFERHQVDKRYWALCRGTVLGAGEIDRALVPVRGGRVRLAREGEHGGKPSRTRWRALERWPGYSAVELRPLSGRLHQVRAHAAAMGHPLAVDPDYGGAEALRVRDLDPAATARPDADDVVVDRVTLHAMQLGLRHPSTEAWLQIDAPLPPDLARAVALLSSRG